MTVPTLRQLAALIALALASNVAAAMTPQDLFTKLSPTIWVVRSQHGDSPTFGMGSAVAIAPRLWSPPATWWPARPASPSPATPAAGG